MSFLMMGPDQVAVLKALRAHAEIHEVEFDEKGEPSTGPDPGNVVDLPGGFRVVFTIHRAPPGTFPGEPPWIRQMSMSSPTPGRVPTPLALAEVMPHLGFQRGFDECSVELEPIGPGHKAVVVAEPIPRALAVEGGA